MNILILDYVPLIVATLATIYNAWQMVRWAEKGKYRCFVYGVAFVLSALATIVANIQIEALQMHDLQQSQVLTMDCSTDWECEQLELAQSEAEDNE